MASAQIPAIPEPPLVLLGTVTDASTNQPVTITSIVWHVTDGTADKSFSAASLPSTRVVSDSGQSFYILEVPFETRTVQNGAGGIQLQPSANAFELKTTSPTYTLSAIINGKAATIKAVEGIPRPANTAIFSINDYTPETQGRMLRVDLFINEDPYLAWAALYFADTGSAQAARTADPDGDGKTNEEEFLAGTDPTNGASGLRITNFSRVSNGTSVSLEWLSTAGKTYQVETNAALGSANWVPLGTPVSADAAITTTSVPTTPGEARRFFRVRVVE